MTLDKTICGLRPGMSAQVEILVDRDRRRPLRPRPGGLEFGGKTTSPSGPGRLRFASVSLGLSNDKLVEVTKGLKPATWSR